MLFSVFVSCNVYSEIFPVVYWRDICFLLIVNESLSCRCCRCFKSDEMLDLSARLALSTLTVCKTRARALHWLGLLPEMLWVALKQFWCVCVGGGGDSRLWSSTAPSIERARSCQPDVTMISQYY